METKIKISERKGLLLMLFYLLALSLKANEVGSVMIPSNNQPSNNAGLFIIGGVLGFGFLALGINKFISQNSEENNLKHRRSPSHKNHHHHHRIIKKSA
jgi:hypothetical protein